MEKYKKMIEQFIYDNDEILAAYYGGSIARNDSDSYSDIDLRLVVNEQTYKDKLLSEFTDSFENILFIEDKTNNFSVFHLDDLSKIDVFVFYKDELTPNIWLNNIDIIKDTDNFLSQIKSQSNKTVTISSGRIAYIRNKYLAYLIETYKREKREEFYYVNYSINMMANIICYLWYLDIGVEPNSLGDWSKYQGIRSKLKPHKLDILDKILAKDYFNQRMTLNKEFLSVLDNLDKNHNIYKSQESRELINSITNKFHNK
ncbi:nucleotidyltransferase domain-containing protein [Mammaliicoccus sciuri]|uniref:nucleotidyltransferase domain-containing protein n=1 Tax=Mammaliicoccus sciuri TaxID=1296 RepID=UPI001FB51B75|nr:nucleotidyltransferase domain-containing protein [Mammaliicoccus sciuri]MCJ0921350.1 nucleotidyltransferase domain-containing protein [Mammaliicoccus sciuri]